MQKNIMNATDAIQKLFEGVIPERLEEVMGLIEKHSAQFRLIGDRDGFNIDGGLIEVKPKPLEAMQSCLQVEKLELLLQEAENID